MRAGDVFMEGLERHGATTLFGNPGTTENPVLDRLVDHPTLTYYTALHEGVAVAAATFHAMASGRTGVVNVHVAPGLGNSIGLMFGALKAGVPLLVTAGQQDTRMHLRRTMFSHDLVAMAAPVTKWSAEPRSGDEVGPMLARAFEIATTPPCGPVFLSLPVDVMEQTTTVSTTAPPPAKADASPAHEIDALANLLCAAQRPAIVVGDDVAAALAVPTLVALAERLGACVYRESMHARMAFPTGHPAFRGRTPFDARNISAALSAYDVLLLVGGQFFEELWHEDGHPVPASARVARIEASAERLASSYPLEIGVVGAIDAVLERLDVALTRRLGGVAGEPARARWHEVREAGQQLQAGIRQRLESLPDTAPMSPMRVIAELTRCLPRDAILVDESLTAALMDYSADNAAIVRGAVLSSIDFGFPLTGAHDYFSGRGGGLGQAMPGALGVQVAHPDRPVVALVGDGSAMYGIQALWSAAHHRLPIVFVIFSNREYRVLKHNLDLYRHRFGIAPGRPYPHMDLSSPSLSLPAVAGGMGVRGETVRTPAELAAAVRRALDGRAPYLIEAEITGKG
ncbi:MAG TPA: thiamine pyrophosphate-binding protein [Nevskiaceae bacterium]|nr:thiamine pyrophosphate-binding protein [Nevskiaceae bacterium]